MVKVVGLSEREKEGRKRTSRLVEIAKDVFPDGKVERSGQRDIHIYLDGGKQSLHVYLLMGNNICVKSQSSLDYAIQLAKAYESRGESEFTVEKDYDE